MDQEPLHAGDFLREMIRISVIFIAICMVLISASLGLVLHSVAGMSLMESAIVAVAALTFMILYNAVSMRMRERPDVNGQIADLSQGTTNLARQVAEFGRRLAAVEGKIVSANSAGQDRLQAMHSEIDELGLLVKQLAASVAAHDDLLSDVSPTAFDAAPSPMPALDVSRDLSRDLPRRAPAVMPPTASAQPDRVNAQILTTVRNAIEANSVDIFLQPIVTLPQRKVRYYEAVTRLRDDRGEIVAADDFIGVAEAAGLMGRIDNMVLLRCVQVLRRLLVRNKDVGVFCNVAGATLSNAAMFAPFLDFLDANRALAPSLVLEFKQTTLRSLGPLESEHLAAVAQRGFRFSLDHVKDLRIEPRELADRGVRFIKVPAALLLDPRQTSSSDIHPADLSDLLGRFGIDLIAERIEGERSVVDLLDYDVRFGQGFLFAAPRPLRPEATAEAAATPGRADPAAPAKPARPDAPRAEAPKVDSPRLTGNAALVRRAGGPF